MKSRQHGFTTLIDLIALDLCLFNDNIEAGIIAHTLKDVQHIFATKIKYPYENLPPSILSMRPALKCDANELKLANNSWLRVATSMRSSTLRFLHVSEHGKLCAKYPLKAEELKTGTMPTLHEGSYLFIESTAEGGGGDFYDACMQSQADTVLEKRGKKLNKKQSRFHFFPWYADPKNKTIPGCIDIKPELSRYFDDLQNKHNVILTEEQKSWYALTRDGAMGLGRLMKREYPSTPAEAFEQSVEGAIFAEEIEKAREEGRIRGVPYNPDKPVVTFWDLGVGHPTTIIFAQVEYDHINLIDYHEEANRGIVYHCEVVNNKPYEYAMHYVPHDVSKRSRETGTPLIDTMGELLGTDKVYRVDRTLNKGDSIEAARQVFGGCYFDSKRLTRLLKCLGFYRYEWDEDFGKYSDKPVDDWSADGADAFQCMGMVVKYHDIRGRGLVYPGHTGIKNEHKQGISRRLSEINAVDDMTDIFSDEDETCYTV